MSTTSSFKDMWINKTPFPTYVFDYVNAPISCINTMDINGIETSSSCSLKDTVKSSAMPCEDIPHLKFMGDNNFDHLITQACQENLRCLTSYVHILL